MEPARRRLAVASAWVGATIVAIGVATAGVGLVANQVTEPPPPVVAGTPLTSADDQPDDEPGDDPSTTPSPVASPSPTPDPTASEAEDDSSTEDDRPSTTPRPTPTPAPAPTPRPSDTVAPSPSPASSASPAASARPSPSPSPSASRSPSDDATPDDDETPRSGQAQTRTAESVGGSASFRFVDGKVELLWASPEPGFRVEVDREGPGEVEVTFESDDHESRIDAEYDDGEPRVRVREKPRDRKSGE